MRFFLRVFNKQESFIKKYIFFLESIIPRIAEENNVVILGRGSQFILQDNPKVIKVLLVADLEDRIKFLEKIWGVSKREAEKTIQTREKRMDVFMKYFNQGRPYSLHLYHLIINTGKMSLEQAEDMIVWFIQDFEERTRK